MAGASPAKAKSFLHGSGSLAWECHSTGKLAVTEVKLPKPTPHLTGMKEVPKKLSTVRISPSVLSVAPNFILQTKAGPVEVLA